MPALLSGLGAVATKPGGGEKLWGAVQQTDDALLGNLGSMLSGNESSMLSGVGAKMLESLFGKDMLNTLVGVLGKFLGGKSDLIAKLLPMIVPAVMGMLSKEVKSGGLDLGGLAKMLMGQKDNISQAMPAGLGNALSGASGLGDRAGFASGLASSPSPSPSAGYSPSEKATSPMGWLLPLVGVLVVGGLIWAMMGDKAEKAVEDAMETVEEGVEDLGGTGDGVTKTISSFRDYFGKLDTTLEGVTDAESAREALPTLEAMNDQLGSLSTAYDQVPAAARQPLTEMVRKSFETQQAAKEAVLEKPGVGDVLKDVLNAIFTKISEMLNS